MTAVIQFSSLALRNVDFLKAPEGWQRFTKWCRKVRVTMNYRCQFVLNLIGKIYLKTLVDRNCFWTDLVFFVLLHHPATTAVLSFQIFWILFVFIYAECILLKRTECYPDRWLNEWMNDGMTEWLNGLDYVRLFHVLFVYLNDFNFVFICFLFCFFFIQFNSISFRFFF